MPSKKTNQKTSNMIKVAGIQMASSPSVSSNLIEAERLIKIASEQGAKIVVLPEYFCIVGAHDTDKVSVREKEGDGPIQRFLSKMAKKHKILLIGGTVPLVSKDPNKVRNSCLVYNEKGEQIARYDKIHLFGLDLGIEHYHEENTIEAGNKIIVVDSSYGKIGLSTCYDLRFPELYRAMGEVDIIVVPSAFTDTTGKAHWETLVRARAIENLCYVIAPAQGGYHLSGRETHGNSMIVDPWGVVLDRLPRGSGVVMASINRHYQESLRKSLPALKHKTIKSV
ncbi:MAG: carbon-nitrogen hydrolase family protein [Methylotenera sp.]|jgi:deaminated glutathione amidase